MLEIMKYITKKDILKGILGGIVFIGTIYFMFVVLATMQEE